ncbi:MAG: NAD(+) synthase [Anaerovoracaceae bacterium]|nr:NAD(+) synthase [Bacillota bacterium]MDY5906625.1 NAD(+) synthase [Anaerovoracaceae bacterium]
MFETGYIRTAAVTPELRVANTEFNTKEIIKLAREAAGAGAGIIVFPELALTSYTCADLFYQQHLYESNLEALKEVIDASADINAVIVTGFYFRYENSLYNCAAVIQNGKLMGIVPKMFLPNNREFYESRWFAAGLRIADNVSSVQLFGEEIPFGHLIFTDNTRSLSFGVEICQDLWMPITPGARLCLNGAHIIVNPSASDETVGKADYRRQLVHQQSAANICGYVYTSSGVYESTTDLVYSGHCIISEYGTRIAENDRFERESTITYGDIDYERIKFERSLDHSLEECTSRYTDRELYTYVYIDPLRVLNSEEKLIRRFAPNPFVPADRRTVDERCEEIFRIQTAGLAKRLEHARAKTAVVGISGGLDSTLALLVCAETFKLLGRDPENIIAVTMPGFGTTDRTYENALTIMRLLGADVREVPIGDAVMAHFEAIGHDPSVHDVTYENCQARERTQILMDIANETGGFVVGTGDLSESALGWSTYNGDHMSMYAVNVSVPKTLVSFVVGWVADNRLAGEHEVKDYSLDNATLRRALHDIMDTPISPELLPPDKDGKIVQKTEERVGPYILHDFFLFYTIRFGMRPRRLLYIAQQTFEGMFEPAYVKKWLREFYRRFFMQQYKRSCIPDGPKVGTVTLSPRGDWRMPSDADSSLWLKEIDECEL